MFFFATRDVRLKNVLVSDPGETGPNSGIQLDSAENAGHKIIGNLLIYLPCQKIVFQLRKVYMYIYNEKLSSISMCLAN